MHLTEKIAFYGARSEVLPSWLQRSCRRKLRRWMKGESIVVTTGAGIDLGLIIGDDVDNQILFNRVFESHLTNLISRLLTNAAGTFLDIGCHLGYYTTLAGSVSSELRLLAFDANPDMVQRCRRNLARNNLTGDVRNYGIGSQHAKLEFNISEMHPSLGTFGAPPEIVQDIKSFTVDVIPLAEVVQSVDGQIPLLKMDIEGFEFEALSSLDESLCEKLKNIVFECSDMRLQQCQRTRADFGKLTWMKDYRIHLVHESQRCEEIASFDQIPEGDQNVWLERR
jgi:FkbM family methyltransferase